MDIYVANSDVQTFIKKYKKKNVHLPVRIAAHPVRYVRCYHDTQFIETILSIHSYMHLPTFNIHPYSFSIHFIFIILPFFVHIYADSYNKKRK